MERTIARSPKIRIILEFIDTFLTDNPKPDDFIDYIHELGLGICLLLPGFQMALVTPGETVSGFNYCLLTCTPEDDIRAVYKRRRFLPIRFKRWLRRHPVRWGRDRRIWARW
jgi:hypothetical protein